MYWGNGERGRKGLNRHQDAMKKDAEREYGIEQYCQNRIANDSQRQAYRKAFPASKRWKDETVDSKASKLEKTGKVEARLKELREQADQLAKEAAQKDAEKACLTRVQKRQILAGIATDPQSCVSDICRAIDLDNKMQGEYIEKVSVSGEINNPFAGMSTADLLKLAGERM